jgi:NAD(P)H dehydrogenase (quinone)
VGSNPTPAVGPGATPSPARTGRLEGGPYKGGPHKGGPHEGGPYTRGVKLIVTGASGQLGRLTAELALQERRPEDLVLVTRTPDALAAFAERGADVRFGDFDQPASLVDAFAGGDRLLLISATDLDRRIEQHRSAIGAAASAGVGHVVYTSGLSPEPPNPAVVAPSHWATEQALRDAGLSWTILRNSLYAEYQVPEAAAAIASGRLVHNRGDGQVAYVSREDCAAVAAAVLAAAGHDGRVYDVTGPQPLDAAALAGLYEAVGGRPVASAALDDESFVAGLVGEGGEDDHLRYGAELVASFGRSIREGHMASCTGTVATLTGRPPRALREVLETHRRELASSPSS